MDIQKQVKLVKEMESEWEYLRRTIDALRNSDAPENWSWVTIHASNDYEVHLETENCPGIDRTWMANLIEEHRLKPLGKKIVEESHKLRDMVNDDNFEEALKAYMSC